MRAAMAAAEVGDDVYGEDPTVNRLEAMAAGMLEKDAALFVSSGTQSNLLALLTHCGRGDEYIAGQESHTYRFEGGGAAVLGGIQPQPLDFEEDGTLDLGRIAGAIKPDDVHFARTRLICLENTQGGKVLPLEYLRKAAAFAKEKNLRLHLDGARIFNASVKLKRPVTEISRHFDSVSLCLSKGLGAPVGSMLCGGIDFIQEARRWRKVVGGGMRQAGVLAAAGVIALRDHVERLAEDHEKARLLSRGLQEIKGLTVESMSAQTNMVFIRVDSSVIKSLAAHLKDRGVMIVQGRKIRLVVHMDVAMADIAIVVRVFEEFFAVQRSGACL